jgi:hypothetical protein
MADTRKPKKRLLFPINDSANYDRVTNYSKGLMIRGKLWIPKGPFDKDHVPFAADQAPPKPDNDPET